MLSAGMVLGVIRRVNRGHVVHGQRRRLRVGETEFGEQRPEVDRFLGRLGGGDYFRLAGGEGNSRLFLGRPRNRGLAIHEDVPRSGVPGGPVGIGAAVHGVVPRGGVSQAQARLVR
eukprot:6190495-Pleurochrysis_carterae.AAC.8